MMNEQECSAVYNELVGMLYSVRLGWVTDQVADVISAGKTVEEMVSGRKSPDLKLNYYTPQEQLLILINAVEKAVVQIEEIESEITTILSHEAKTSALKPELRFTSPGDGKGKLFKYSIESVNLKKEQAQELRNLLEQLRQEVMNDVN